MFKHYMTDLSSIMKPILLCGMQPRDKMRLPVLSIARIKIKRILLKA